MLKIQFKDGRSDPVSLDPPGKTIGRGDINDIVIDQGVIAGEETLLCRDNLLDSFLKFLDLFIFAYNQNFTDHAGDQDGHTHNYQE